jgi:hypothetical protein
VAFRFPSKVDGNQNEIVRGLRKLGWTVRITSSLKDGGGDVVVGAGGRNVMLEIKDMTQARGKKLTGKEPEFHDAWRGQIDIVVNLDEAIDVVVRETGVSA